MANINIQQVVADLLHGSESYLGLRPSSQSPIESRMAALKELARVLIQDKTCTASSFMGVLEDLFKGIRTCLSCPSLMNLSANGGTAAESKEVASSQVSSNNNQVSDAIVEVVLKANQVLFEMMPDICHQEDLEIQMAQLIPIFIENLGSPKAVVRKSTHKCIGTYVKLTKKIEFVILHIIHTGLENSNSRTRQHSMLVIPALLSLKTTVMEKECTELKELINAVLKRIKSDSSEIVSKTGKKLILELQKCYPNAFKAQYIDTMRNQEDRQICLAVMANDDAMLKQILQGQQQAMSQLGPAPGGKSTLYNKQGNELSIVGREIMNGNSLTPNLTKSSEKDLWIKEAKPEPKYPRFSNGLLFSFLKDEQVETLTDENKDWKERTAIIESIEAELNLVLATSDRKMDFLPYATPFVGFILQFIKDINFKISLTAIQIAGKLLVLSIVNIQKHYSQLVTSLIEKLSDSKVVIRQAVLKCCGLIITSHSPGLFSQHAMRFLQHTNWHVREGILHLTANCLIAQSQQDELNNASGIGIDKSGKHSSSQGSSSGQPADNVHLALSPTLISELCQVTKIETKSKIQQMAVDCLALCLDISPNRNKTEQLMMREFGIGMDFSQDKDRLITKDFQLISQIKERQNPDCLPTMQIDGSIEFKPAGITPTSTQDGPASQLAEIGAPRDGPKSPKGIRAISGAQTDSKQSTKHQSKLQKRGEDDLQLQMRFQQERVHNNQSHAATAQKSSLLPQPQQQQQQQAFDLVVPQAALQLQPNYQLQNRQQHSLSTVNNPALNSLRDQQVARPGAEVKGSAPEFEVPTPAKSALVSKNRPEAMGAGLQQKDEIPGLKSASKPEDDGRDQAKISMWLPSFQGQHQAAAQHGNKQINETKVAQSPYVNASSSQEASKMASQKPRVHQAAQISAMATNPVKLDRLNATASSSATFVDDGRSIITNTTLVSSQNNKITSGAHSNQRVQNINSRMLTSPAQSENQKNIGQQQNIKMAQPGEGYTPEPHTNKPRHIQSNEIRQRTLEDISLSQASPSPKHVRIGGTTQNDFISIQQSPRMINETQSSKAGQVGGGHSQVISHSEIKVQQRNMSQSSGAPGGFHVDKSQINERLQLLKSTFKYKNPSDAEMQSNLEEMKSFDNVDPQNKYRGERGGKASSEYAGRGVASKPATLNNNNYMLQTAGSGARVSGTGSKILGNPQQTHNSFGFSNVSTNVNNTSSNHHNAGSSSANRQMPSSNTTGYNIGGPAAGKTNMASVYANSHQNSAIGGVHGPGKGFMAGNSNAGGATGPIKATALPQHDFLQTIQIEEHPDKSYNGQFGNNENNDGNPAMPGSLNLKSQKSQQQPGRTRKPPVATKTATSTALGSGAPNQDIQRANSVTMYEQPGIIGSGANLPHQIEKQPSAASSVTHYNAPEEPLRNPELQFKQSIENLKSDDWQTVFDSLNVVKRIAMFHKHLLAASGGTAGKECIKSVVKQTDNLRSQVAKNACMTLQTVFSELPTKDLDPNIDLVLAALLKKATDTNHFVSEQAEKALTMVCHACTDSKVFNCLQAQSGRANALKQKICMCYSTLIAKLGQRIKTFRECDRLVKTVVSMLSEGAQEVRNQAKLAILTLKNNLQNGREFDGLLMRCNLTDKQIEQAKKVAEQGDYESLSNYANTRYGGSMRGSSMDSRSAAEAQRRTPNHLPRNLASGSDGFAQSSFSDSKMQATFLSGGAGAASQLQNSNYGASNGFGMTGSSNQAFKKRQASVSKPVDPQLMEDFKNMINSCSTNDWNKRLESIDTLHNWIAQHSISVKQTQPAKFIQLVDVQCKLAQDNNAKVQTKALQSFGAFLQTENLRQLIDQNLTMIVQALSHNLASTSPSVRSSSEELIALLASTTEVPAQLIQPLVAQLNLSTTRAKAPLVERLAHIIQQIDQPSLSAVDRYVAPLLKPNSKLSSEASTNPRLRDALQSLEAILQRTGKK